jgi:hypothetical protein
VFADAPPQHTVLMQRTCVVHRVRAAIPKKVYILPPKFGSGREERIGNVVSKECNILATTKDFARLSGERLSSGVFAGTPSGDYPNSHVFACLHARAACSRLVETAIRSAICIPLASVIGTRYDVGPLAFARVEVLKGAPP